jgi:hypothetical protein
MARDAFFRYIIMKIRHNSMATRAVYSLLRRSSPVAGRHGAAAIPHAFVTVKRKT